MVLISLLKHMLWVLIRSASLIFYQAKTLIQKGCKNNVELPIHLHNTIAVEVCYVFQYFYYIHILVTTSIDPSPAD